MKTFLIYIKSHTNYPDYEDKVDAYTKEEAVELFYARLRGEFDRKFIAENVIDEELINK